MLWVFILINYISDYSLSQDTLCTKILTLDCDAHYVSSRDESVCAYNGVTHKNCCHFAQAKCRDEHISIKHGGPCNTTMTTPNNTVTSMCGTIVTTTMTTTTTTTTADFLNNLFCSGVAAGSVKCTDELDPYCGTDGVFYLNNCHFEEARCKDNNLFKQPIDICKDLTTKGMT